MNAGFVYRERIPAGADGTAVVDYLSERYPHSTRATWRGRIAAGQVTVRGEPAAAGDALRAGDPLVWRRPPWEEPPVPLAFAILHQDDHLLAVAKPRGLPTVPNGGYLEHTLLHAVRRVHPEATPMHRLGRGTSGVVLFARTADARRTVAAAWRAGAVEKEYRALVDGIPARAAFAIATPIGPVAHPLLGRVHAATPSGKPSRSDVRVLAARDNGALVAVTIATGRPHQIRIHLAAAGHPLAGDPLYVAGGAPRPGVLPGAGGYRLHAVRLALDHPATGRRITMACAPPPDLRD
jgi:23S rRNA pseudouridine1911/1915/1917 synthase